uniref:Uncharacterized protein n=1 Tax=Rhizophora mucronata TaxID=61149 RepID=A0A2P2IJG5_RHIMU
MNQVSNVVVEANILIQKIVPSSWKIRIQIEKKKKGKTNPVISYKQ